MIELKSNTPCGFEKLADTLLKFPRMACLLNGLALNTYMLVIFLSHLQYETPFSFPSCIFIFNIYIYMLKAHATKNLFNK